MKKFSLPFAMNTCCPSSTALITLEPSTGMSVPNASPTVIAAETPKQRSEDVGSVTDDQLDGGYQNQLGDPEAYQEYWGHCKW